MEDIRTTFTLDDQISKSLNIINDSLKEMIDQMEESIKWTNQLDDADFNSLEKSLKTITSSFSEVDNAALNAQKGLEDVNKVKFDSVTSSTSKVTSSMDSLEKEASEAASEVSKVGRSNNLSSITSDAAKAAGKLDSLEYEAKDAASVVRSVGKETSIKTIETDANSAAKALDNLEREAKEAGNATASIKMNASLDIDSGESSGLISKMLGKVTGGAEGGGGILQTILGTATGGAIGGLVSKGVSMAVGAVKESISSALDRIDVMDTFSQKMTIITGSSEIAQKALNDLKEVVTGTAYGLDTAAKAVQNFVTRGMDTGQAVKLVQTWTDTVSMFGKGTNEELETVTDALGKMMSKGTVEMEQLNRLTDVGINAVDMYANAVGRDSASVQTDLSNGAISAADFITTVSAALDDGSSGFASVSGYAKEAGSTWSATFDNMKAAVTRGVQSIITSIDEMLSNAGLPTMKEMLAGLGKLFEQVLGGIGKFATTVLSPVVSVIGWVFKSLGGLFGFLSEAVSNVWKETEGVRSFFVGAWENIQTKVSPIIEGISNFFSETLPGALGGFMDFIRPALDDLKDKLTIVGRVFGWIGDTIMSAIGPIFGFINDAFIQPLVNGFMWLWNELMNEAAIIKQNVIDPIVSAFSWLWEQAQAIWGAITDYFMQAIQPIIDALSPFISFIMDNLVGPIVDAFNGLWNTITSAWDGICNAFTEAGARILEGKEDIGQILGDLWNTVTGKLGEIWGGFVEFGENVWNTLTETAGKMLEVGGQIVQGLWDGIKGAWDGFTSWISDSFSSITDTVCSIFGIASPSKEFEDIGNYIMEGLQQGLEQLHDSIMSMLMDMANQIIAIFQPDGGAVDFSALIAAAQGQLGVMQSVISQTYATISSETIQYSTTIATAVAEVISGSLNAVVGYLGQLSSTVQAALTEISTQFSDAFTMMTEGMRTALTDLTTLTIESLLSLSSTSILTIQEMIAGMVQAFLAGATQIASIATNIAKTVNSTFATMATTALAIHKSTLLPGLISVWNSISANVVSIVNSMIAKIINLIALLVSSMLKILTSSVPSFRTIGKAMMQALNDGIASQIGAVLSTTSALVEQLKQTFITGLGIHSPSHFMRYVGEMMAAGLMKGLSPSQISSFTEGIVKLMQNSFDKGQFNATELVQYLGDDTPQLIAYLSGVDASGLSPEQIAYPLIGTMGTISSYFGHRASPGGIGSTNHGGIDLASPTGTPIASALAGTIVQAGWNGGYGQSVTVDHGNGVKTLYGHMSKVLATVGQTVTKGSQIGLVGSTGNSTGPHLHFEVYQNGTRVDPLPYLQGAGLLAGNTLQSAIQLAYNSYKGISTTGQWMGGKGAGVAQSAISQALSILGMSQSYLPSLMWAAYNESGYDPNSLNDWDSNWYAGTPSKGLFQTIDPTFNAYKLPGYDNIWNPVDNAIAAIRYMIGRYGSIENVVGPRAQKWYGYAVGTRYVPSDMLAMIHEGEAIIPKSQNPYSQSGGDYLQDIFSNSFEKAFTEEPRSRISLSDYPVSSSSTHYSGDDISITVNTTVNNNGDLENAEERIYNVIVSAINRESKTTGGVRNAV